MKECYKVNKLPLINFVSLKEALKDKGIIHKPLYYIFWAKFIVLTNRQERMQYFMDFYLSSLKLNEAVTLAAFSSFITLTLYELKLPGVSPLSWHLLHSRKYFLRVYNHCLNGPKLSKIQQLL